MWAVFDSRYWGLYAVHTPTRVPSQSLRDSKGCLRNALPDGLHLQTAPRGSIGVTCHEINIPRKPTLRASTSIFIYAYMGLLSFLLFFFSSGCPFWGRFQAYIPFFPLFSHTYIFVMCINPLFAPASLFSHPLLLLHAGHPLLRWDFVVLQTQTQRGSSNHLGFCGWDFVVGICGWDFVVGILWLGFVVGICGWDFVVGILWLGFCLIRLGFCFS